MAPSLSTLRLLDHLEENLTITAVHCVLRTHKEMHSFDFFCQKFFIELEKWLKRGKLVREDGPFFAYNGARLRINKAPFM